MYLAKQISDWILSKVNTESGDTISPLKLQKLLYYCQAWHLTIYNNPLFEENIEAWAHGPVVPSQYSRFAYILRNEQIKPKSINIEIPIFSSETKELLIEVLETYGEHSANYLENLTHKEKPWLIARGELPVFARSSNVISHQSMVEYYSAFRK